MRAHRLGAAAPLTRRRCLSGLAGLLALTLLLLLLSLCVGSTAHPPWQLWQSGPEGALAREIVWSLRLPRSLAALAVGGLLALAGLMQQVLLRNPLADPYILGTSGGASVGALGALLLGAGGLGMTLGAGGGALVVTLLVFWLARNDTSSGQARLLLTGVAMASFCGALSALLLSLAPDGLLRSMIFWMLGDLTGAQAPLALGMLAGLSLLLWPLARTLNVLSLGGATAHSLGLNPGRLRWVLYFASALASAAALTTAGMIGFVGLIVPHGLRRLLGPDHRLLVPACVLGGACVLLAADLVSRTVLAPQQLPVGVVTALGGVPVFLYLLYRREPRA